MSARNSNTSPKRGARKTAKPLPKRAFTRKAVLLHLQDRAGQRFAPKQIAHMFQRATVEARKLLDALFEEGLVRSGVDGTTRVFYIAGPQDQPRTSDRIVGRGELKGWEAGLRRFEALCMTVRR